MPELAFSVIGAEPEPLSLTPLLVFRLAATESSGDRIDSIALRCQIMIEAARRPYVGREQDALLDLFGSPSRYGRTLKTMVWTHVSTVVPGFRSSTEFDLAVPCTYDLTVAAGKYFFALEGGDVPLTLQFSGTVFWRTAEGDELTVSPIPWTQEAPFRLPVATWRRLMDDHYPDGTWLFLDRDVTDRLLRYKARHGLPTWTNAVDALLAAAEATVPSP